MDGRSGGILESTQPFWSVTDGKNSTQWRLTIATDYVSILLVWCPDLIEVFSQNIQLSLLDRNASITCKNVTKLPVYMLLEFTVFTQIRLPHLPDT